MLPGRQHCEKWPSTRALGTRHALEFIIWNMLVPHFLMSYTAILTQIQIDQEPASECKTTMRVVT